jgi:hypothetical protein
MIGFLFGLAAGTVIGFLLGCIAMAGSKMEREMDRVSKPQEGVVFITPRVAPIDRYRPHLDAPKRKAAGVRVCSCIGKTTRLYPNELRYNIDPDCPFHGGAA